MNVIEVQNLHKQFNGLVAVDAISFSVEKAEFFGLLGPNGAGKTTTIRMLYGFLPSTTGSIRIFGMDIRRDWRRVKARIGVCQQDNTLDPDLTVEQNLHVFAGYFSISKKKPSNAARSFSISSRFHIKKMPKSWIFPAAWPAGLS